MAARAVNDDWGPGASIVADATLDALHAALEETPLARVRLIGSCLTSSTIPGSAGP